MALSAVDKNKLGKFVRESSIEKLYYAAYFDISNRKSKYTDLDLLEYFTDLLSNVLGSKKVISQNLLEKYAISFWLFVEVVKENGDELDNSLLAKVISLNEMYQSYVEELGEEKSEEVEKYLAKANELFKEELDEQLSGDSKSTLEYIAKINELEAGIKLLESTIAADKRKIASLTKKNESLVSDGVEKSKYLNEAKQELVSLKKEFENISQELSSKTDELVELKRLHHELTEKFNERKSEIEKLSRYNRAHETMIKAYELESAKIEDERSKSEKYEKLIQHIIGILSTSQMTAMELLGKCKRDGFDVTIDLIKKALFDIEKKYIIRNRNRIVVPPLYKLERPQTLTNAELFLDSKGKDCVDVLLVSDLHLNRNPEYLKRIFDTMYSYCSANDIKHIWDVGDFLHSRRPTNDIDEFNKLRDFFVENLPIDSRYNYMVLGGNHDKNLVCYEGDLLQDICDLKEGMYFLGHKHAFIYFDKNKDNAFALHHPDVKYNDSLYESDMTMNGYTQQRTGYYSGESRKLKKTYADIIGHSHFGRIDMLNGCIYTPSLTNDRFLNGAYHLKIHFDENKNINYMTIIHLIHKNEKLKTISESTYQKLELKL